MIYVVDHNFNSYLCLLPFSYPIQVGAFNHVGTDELIRTDNTGDNISERNPSYCELTAQYWAWKNEYADYYGFFHYRRYLSFEKDKYIDFKDSPRKVLRPYTIEYLPDDITLQKYGYNTENMQNFISQYDIIAPIAEEQHITVYEQYRQAPEHNIEDLDCILRIIDTHYPDYSHAAKTYMQYTRIYFCNMYIMKKEYFYDYCQWLFGILEIFDSERDCSGYQGKMKRVNGYLGERLFGIYYTWLKQNEELKWAEVPRIHFEGFTGETDNFSKMKRINKILPPGTWRRSLIKKLIKGAQV